MSGHWFFYHACTNELLNCFFIYLIPCSPVFHSLTPDSKGRGKRVLSESNGQCPYIHNPLGCIAQIEFYPQYSVTHFRVSNESRNPVPFILAHRHPPLSKQMVDLPTSCILTATLLFLAQKGLSLYSSRLSQVIDTQNEHIHPCIFPPVCVFWWQCHTLSSLLTIYPCIFPASICILMTDNSHSQRPSTLFVFYVW